MKQEIAYRWIAALESGEFNQTTGILKNSDGYCCLGVLCQIAVEDGVIDPPVQNGPVTYYMFDDSTHYLPEEVVNWAEMRTDSGEMPDYSLINMNDVAGASFKEIAQVIRENWEIL